MAHGTGFLHALWLIVGMWLGFFLAEIAHPAEPCECGPQSVHVTPRAVRA